MRSRIAGQMDPARPLGVAGFLAQGSAVFLDDRLRHRTPDADVVVLAVGLLDLIGQGRGW